MAIIRIDQLKVSTIIGTNAWERKKKQSLWIDVEVEYDSRKSTKNDDLNDALDYFALTEEIKTYTAKSSFFLIEKLCNEILNIIWSKPLVQRVLVRIHKPQALKNTKNLSVELHKSR